MSAVDDLHRRFSQAMGEAEGAAADLALRRAVAHEVLDRHMLPDALADAGRDLCHAWLGGIPDEAQTDALAEAIWAYLLAKHGNSTTIADREDCTLRGFLALTRPYPDENDLDDSLGWAAEMLARAPWPRALRYF